MSPKPCTWSQQPHSVAAREFGCPLDHCACGTHDAECKEHACAADPDDDDRQQGCGCRDTGGTDSGPRMELCDFHALEAKLDEAVRLLRRAVAAADDARAFLRTIPDEQEDAL